MLGSNLHPKNSLPINWFRLLGLTLITLHCFGCYYPLFLSIFSLEIKYPAQNYLSLLGTFTTLCLLFWYIAAIPNYPRLRLVVACLLILRALILLLLLFFTAHLVR